MPIYAYLCERCGSFEKNNPLADFDKAVPCPSCHQLAFRTVSAARLNLMPASKRSANALNEKSSSEPRIIASDTRRVANEANGDHGSRRNQTQLTKKKQSCASSRPWLVGH